MNRYLPLALLALTISCESQQERAARAAAVAKVAEQQKIAADEAAKKQASDAAASAAKAKEEAAAKKARFESLKPKFNQTKDKFSDEITWRHKTFTAYFNTNGRGIVAEIIDGRMKCYSAYVSDDWLFHTSFTVKVGDQQKTFSGKEQHEVINGIAECVNLNRDDSEELARFIADSDPKKPILMRYLGKWYKDITLSESHRRAISDTWRFYNTLK